MSDTLSYADAVRLLGGEKSKVVDWFDKLTGGVLLAASVPVPALLGIFDAKAEFVRLGHELVRGVSEKRSGLSRYGRTQRLEAAHAVIAVTAFFEALSSVNLPVAFADLELCTSEQLALAGAGPADARNVVHALFEVPAPIPTPEVPYSELRTMLGVYYAGMSTRLVRFVQGLAVWDQLGDSAEQSFHEALRLVPTLAVSQHRDLLSALVASFPEVAYWSGLQEHDATRQKVQALAVGLGELREVLTSFSTGGVPDERRGALIRAYRAQLDRPIITSGEVPDGLRVPTLGEAYVPPLCRVTSLGGAARPSGESWWSGQPLRNDLVSFLTGYFTSPGATRAPLLVLGQPGSGKSVLTRILAAQLPETDFLVVRVPLREVQAEAELQAQIEQAVRAVTGERLDWPVLARSAGDALPVVLLDGFDELLQATGVSQTDYLLRVADFQRREADQGRPVAVVVTTRTSVADRAEPPSGTVALRLEPFDRPRVERWVATWNAANSDRFPALGVPPLDPSAVLAHSELAEQPLLLLMLALYDADGNDLRAARALRRGELYERLLYSFARREVVKHQPGLPDRELSRATEAELRRLAVVAFAMFNRGAQWVTEDELEADLAALPFLVGGASARQNEGTMRAPLRAAEIVLGRFFFVHRAQAARTDRRMETYEFLHATFGEYLVARTAALVLDDMAAREAASSMLRAATPEDDPLHALLSFATLTGRAPVVGFLTESLRGNCRDRRAVILDVLLRLFRTVHDLRPARHLESYQPRVLSAPERHAAYSANLLVLALCVSDDLRGSDLYPDAPDVRAAWHRQALLWRSQLPEGEYHSLINAVALVRLGSPDEREVGMSLAGDGRRPPELDLDWTYGVPSTEAGYHLHLHPLPEIARRRAHFECDVTDDVVQHVLDPLVYTLPEVLSLVMNGPGTERRSVAQAVLAMALRGSHAGDAYRTVAGLVADAPQWDGAPWLAGLLLDRLATDTMMSRAGAVQLLADLESLPARGDDLAFAYLRCCLALIGEDDAETREIGHLVAKAVRADQESWQARTEEVAVEALVRLAELGVGRHRITPHEASRLALLLERRRPDLVRRLEALVLAPVRPAPSSSGLALPGEGRRSDPETPTGRCRAPVRG